MKGRCDLCRSAKCLEDQTDIAERDEGLMQTAHLEAPDADATSHAELPPHLQDKDGSDAGNITFAAKVVL